MDERGLGVLGLAVRAGKVTIGTSAVRSLLQRGEAHLVVVARDVSPRTLDKVVRLAEARGVPTVGGPPSGELGRRFGRPAIQSLAVRDRGLAARITSDRQSSEEA